VFTSLLEKMDQQEHEYDHSDPRARVHPHLSELGVSRCFYSHKLPELIYMIKSYVTDKPVRVWKYGCEGGHLVSQRCTFNLKVRGDEGVVVIIC
jgi:hypothetical protein